ncbi:serine/threonine-protein kinase [Xanthobacter oligotrophicus]|uniref:serine/threonine-protein kinase n=1 Tax=Xanthobacter oligotrophicus TaxID=2607286 RepID=UPI0011F10F95|nr:serine/threonine-protein kinase [Xanthobacter oligotrophicus]MCG5237816.1 serine/threonine-protein kinase [Xanthobacter oligotrophicus]
MTTATTEHIGHYEITALLGSGGNGRVHAARDTMLGREVAIKSLRPELMNDASFLDRFRAEASSLARLNHPNIATLYALHPEGSNLYMIMELVRGRTLESMLQQRGGPLPVQECLAIVAQVADGLAYAHSMGVIHRDIKPSNLMITDDGRVKIMDFGIARVAGSQRLTRDGSIIGTLAYIAPEQLRGSPGDERSDLYSLAIVIYEILSGAPPFAADTDYDLIQAHVNTKPQRLIPKVPGLSVKAEGAILQALAKKPEQRFPTVRAFSDALGATSLRAEATGVIQNYTRLISSTSGGASKTIAPYPLPAPGPMGRLRAALNAAWLRFKAMPIELRGLAIGGVAAIAVAGVVVADIFRDPTPVPAPRTDMARPTGERRATTGNAATGAAASNAARIENMYFDRNTRSSTTAATTTTEAKVATAPPAMTPADLRSAMGEAMERRDYGRAYELASRLAETGNAEALYTLGFLLEKGEGVGQSFVSAAYKYRQAAEKDLAKAQWRLGNLYYTGKGFGAPDYKEARAWYLKAAQQGIAEAQYNLGVIFENGQGIDPDRNAARYWYDLAAAQGNARARQALEALGGPAK